MKLSLEDKNWKEFSISELFEIVSGKDITERERKNGETPFITATSENNGIGDYVGNNNKTLEARCISVNRTGSVGYAFYHPYKALYSNNCRKLRPKQKLSDSVLDFITAQINKQRGKYSYGYILGTGRLKRQKILLPSDSQGNPDYKFMEAYMRQKEQEKLDKYKEFVSKRLAELQDYKDVEALEYKEWGEFRIEDVFAVKSGKRLTKADMSKGHKPFIGATDSNNGITEYVSNTNQSEDSNVLGVNYNGSVVENFYHPYTAIFSDDVKRLSFREVEGNKHQFLFVKAQILKQKAKYQYGYKFNAKRMNRQRIMLPMNNQNRPDYEYMENYMKRLEYRKIKQYLDIKK